MTRHFESDELLAYIDKNEAVVDLEVVEAHLRVCARCTERLANVQSDYDLLSDPRLWMDITDALPGSRAAEYSSLRRRIETENASADDIYRRLSIHPRETWLEHIQAEHPACLAALARRIVTAAREEEESTPRKSLELLAIAEAVISFANRSLETVDVSGDLWKERANTLMVLGDYPAALLAIDEAEKCYASGTVAAYDLAFTAWARASVFFEMGRYREARPLADEAATTLRQFGDRTHERQVQVLAACIRYEEGDIESAERLFSRLLVLLTDGSDRVTEARLLANVACCRLMRDDLVGAERLAQRAASMYEQFGLTTEIIRTRWALATAHLRRGNEANGLEELERVARSFQEQGLLVDAAEVELDIVAELLRLNEHERAAAIAGRLATIFVGAEARASTARALAYLRDAALAKVATPDLVRAVRHTLTHPEHGSSHSPTTD